jgi:hypothetical protein
MWGFCSFSGKFRRNFEAATTARVFIFFSVHHSPIIQEAVNRSQMQVKQQIKNDCVGEGQQKLTGPYWTGVVH